MEKSWRIIDIINWGTDYFINKNISEPRLHIELILGNVLNYDRMKLYLDYEKPLNEEELATVKNLVKRKIKREPIQYILGKTQFMKYPIFVDRNVLIPRPETELLVELVFKKFPDRNNLKILDIGTGSGCISIALGDHYKSSEISAIDISQDALEIAKKNSLKNGINNINFIQMDILNKIPKDKFDLIVSNPPYISENEYLACEPEVLYYEPKNALSDFGDGYKFYKRFSEVFNNLLKPDGMFFLEIAYNQKIDLKRIFEQSYKIDIFNDFSDLPRYIIGEKMKNF